MLTQILVWTCCGVIATCCGLAALHPQFDDNLAQRLGLGGVALATTGIGAQGDWSAALVLVLLALAAYCLGTVFKFWKRTHGGVR
jgi:hypothetical protein